MKIVYQLQSYSGSVALVFYEKQQNFCQLSLSHPKSCWASRKNFCCKQLILVAKTLKQTFLAQKRILLIKKTTKNDQKRKIAFFFWMTPFFEGSGGLRGVLWLKTFFTKICPRTYSRNLRSLGASEKPFFGNLNSKPRGAPAPPPVAGGLLTTACVHWQGCRQHDRQGMNPF